MFGLKGFDIVIENPPYVSTEKIDEPEKIRYKKIYDPIHKSRIDVYAYFYYRGLELTEKGSGLLCYITSNKWLRAGYGEKLRGYFADKKPLQLIDFGGFKVFESATVDTNILHIQNAQPRNNFYASHFKNDYQKNDDIAEYFNNNKVLFENPSTDPWFIGSPAEVALKKKIEEVGKPLIVWDVKIYRGIITGYNEAFIIDQKKRDELVAKDPKSEEIIKQVLRGRDIERYGYDLNGLYVILAKFSSYKNTGAKVSNCISTPQTV